MSKRILHSFEILLPLEWLPARTEEKAYHSLEERARPPCAFQVQVSSEVSDDELDKWAATYKEVGLLFPIVVFVDNEGEERGEKGPFPEYLLAGAHRLAMFE